MRKIIWVLTLLFPIFSFGQTQGEPRVSNQKVIFHTNLGDMTLGFYPDIAPKHVEQIIRLAGAGGYDNTDFFRIEPGFVAQIDNFRSRRFPLPDELQKTIQKLPAEFSSLPHVRGTLSMARFDDPNSAESSFSFVLARTPHLDHNYTVIGKVIAGMEVLAAIEKVPTASNHRPLMEVKVVRAEVVGEPDQPQDPSMIRWVVCGLMVVIVASGLVSTLRQR